MCMEAFNYRSLGVRVSVRKCVADIVLNRLANVIRATRRSNSEWTATGSEALRCNTTLFKTVRNRFLVKMPVSGPS